MIASEGEIWKSQRRMMQPDFLPGRVAAFFPLMTQEIENTTRLWDAAALRGETIDVSASITRMALRIVARALFSEDLSDSHATALCQAFTDTIVDLGKLSLSAFGAEVQMSPQRNANFLMARQAVDAICREIIARRRAMKDQMWPDDLLSLMLRNPARQGAAADVLIRDEIVTMLTAGHETTAAAMSWTLILLAQNPTVEQRLYRELDQTLGDQSPRIADLTRLPWTTAIFQEVMRLYPPVWVMPKVAARDDVVDGYPIARGQRVIVSPWLTHRHKSFWNSPDRFDPERFLAERGGAEAGDGAQRHRYAYFPFSGGRHQCLGIHFAMIEAPLILATFAQRFRVHPLNPQEMRSAPSITLRQSHSLRANVERRQRTKIGS